MSNQCSKMYKTCNAIINSILQIDKFLIIELVVAANTYCSDLSFVAKTLKTWLTKTFHERYLFFAIKVFETIRNSLDKIKRAKQITKGRIQK